MNDSLVSVGTTLINLNARIGARLQPNEVFSITVDLTARDDGEQSRIRAFVRPEDAYSVYRVERNITILTLRLVAVPSLALSPHSRLDARSLWVVSLSSSEIILAF